MKPDPSDVADLLMSRVRTTAAGCWQYFGHSLTNLDGKRQTIARVAYQLWVGTIPEGHEVSRTCSTGTCIKPEHLHTQPHGTALRTALVGSMPRRQLRVRATPPSTP